MQVIADAYRRPDLPAGTVGTIGNYDGIHRGQRKILDRVVERARSNGLASAVVTFDPHPAAVLRPGAPVPRLTTPEQKRALLRDLGIDFMLEVEFDEEFARTSAESFVRDFLVGRLRMREIFVGRRFAFGRDREAELPELRKIGARHGLEAHGIDEVEVDGEPISSTRIRRAIVEGRVEEAARLLGRPYAVSGRVVRGDGRGRQLGWPTANLDPFNDLLPADGVYACRIHGLDDERSFAGISNVGVRPTFDGSSNRVLESHLFDFEGDLYGSKIEIALCRRLRGERRFESADALIEQIGADVAAAREYLASGRC